MPQAQTRWTNESVRLLAGDEDPVEEILRRSRQVVLEAMDKGWNGPPFDPLELARLRGIQVVGRDEVRDARTVASDSGELRIEANPNRPRARMRYSVAHELGHTLFPDCRDLVRNRAVYHEMVGDEWQLEALCNLAAAEFLMPAGTFPALGGTEVTIDKVLELRREFEVSTEAVLLRIVRLAHEPLAMFTASAAPGAHKRYFVDYAVSAPLAVFRLRARLPLPADTVIAECTAIGYTAKATETWEGRQVRVEAVGVAPYPGASLPRVVGLAAPVIGEAEPYPIRYLRGDALQPRDQRPAIIAQIVNDKAITWGGGFAYQARSRFPQAQESFRRWARMHRKEFQLGGTHIVEVEPGLWMASMVAQEGYGPAPEPRIRYGALQVCLRRVADLAKELGASVHMPRIGAGQAGGNWEIIEQLILEGLCEQGLQVTVYDLVEGQPYPPHS